MPTPLPVRGPDGVPLSEYSVQFLQGMVNRMAVSYHKYGKVSDAYPIHVDAIESLRKRLLKYKETGNTEWLMDVANFCLAPRARVWMRDLSWIPLGQVEIGDEVIGFTEDPVTRRTQRAWCASTVLAKDRIVRPCVRVTLSTGFSMIASIEHRWLAAGRQGTGWYYKWIEGGADDRSGLRQHGPHYMPLIAPVVNPFIDYDSGWLGGFLDGEGHANQTAGRVGSLRVTWGQNPGPVLDKVNQVLKDHHFAVSESSTRKCVTGYVRGGRHESLRLLQEVRPLRLIASLDPDRWGAVRQAEVHEVVSVEEVGEREVIALGTSSGTFVAEGYGHHNCMIEFMHPAHDNAHFEAQDSSSSPGRSVTHGKAYDTNRDLRDDR